MSYWNPQKSDPWYADEELDRTQWKSLLWCSVLDILLILAVASMIAIVAFGLGYFNVFK
jgi:hypothetical protein